MFTYLLLVVDANAVPIVAGQVRLVPLCLVEAIANSILVYNFIGFR